jgi:hypothetical protein
VKTYENLFLFGAGASYGHCKESILPNPPPLGRTLAKALAERYTLWKLLFSSCNASEWSDFESTFQNLTKKHQLNILVLYREMAHFFASFRISSDSAAYCQLLRMLHKAEHLNCSAFATLNYETLFEQALRLEGRNPVTIAFDDGLGEKDSLLLKVHGSASFVLDRNIVQVSNAWIPPTMRIDSPIEELSTIDAMQYFDDQLATSPMLMPVMCLYAKRKTTSLAASGISEIQSRYSKIVLSAKRIVIIGASAALHDSHVWGPIKLSRANVIYFGGERDFRRISNYIQHHRCRFGGQRIDDAISSIPSILN